MTLRLALICILALASTAACAMTPLHQAAASGDTAVVKEWIARKRNLNVTYDEPMRAIEGNYARNLGVTALMVAAHFGQLEVAKLLVGAGADLYAESRSPDGAHGRNAFDYAVEGKQLEVARYLWSKADGTRLGARLPEHISGAQGELALFLISIAPAAAADAKRMGDATCRRALMPGGIDFLEKNRIPVPRSSLHCVAYGAYVGGIPDAQRLAAATWLLDNGADPNDRSAPWTPLVGAAFSHDMEMVKLLLARGGDPNLRTAEGYTPIGAAANICIHGAGNRSLPPQVAMVEHLASVSDKKVYASAEARSKLSILSKCCAQPESAEQRRICSAFGL